MLSSPWLTVQVHASAAEALVNRCDVFVDYTKPDNAQAMTRENAMSKLRVHSISISIDGYGAGPGQDLQHPLGVNGTDLFEWFIHTRTWRRMQGNEDGETGVDDDTAARGFAGIGAWILGRNMFGPVRGPWPDESWKGWWGDEPPYHTPVFVLTHHARAPLRMSGGTVFHFVTGGIHAALQLARDAAGGLDIRLGGGVSTIRQYLQAALVDELQLTVSPVLLGTGEHLLGGLDTRALGYECVEHTAGARAVAHVILRKRA
jgi:dihydrofolate reductase